ncbi:MAG: hypothetical protein IH886_07390 [Nitrospinae bacterium]|nr:hypothetical protein [Nitrospinota bacterium]
MKTVKIIGSAFLFFLLMAVTGFADSDAEELEEANARMKNLYNELKESKPKFDIKIADLLGKSSSDVDDINKANQLILFLERELQRITPTRSCIDDQPFEAETECPFYMHFYSAVEFIGSNEFGESFARGGMQLRSTLAEWSDNKRISLMVDLALTSRVVQTEQNISNPSIFKTEGAKALEGRMGLMIDLFNPTTSFTGTQSYTATNTIALLADLGFDSVENLPSSFAPNENPSDLLQHHFAGIRVYHRGINRFNGAYVDIGWGMSENFLENEAKRFKVRGYLPILINKKTQFKLVAMIEVDSDFKEGPDETKLIVGATIAPEAFFRIPGFSWFTDLLDGE